MKTCIEYKNYCFFHKMCDTYVIIFFTNITFVIAYVSEQGFSDVHIKTAAIVFLLSQVVNPSMVISRN